MSRYAASGVPSLNIAGTNAFHDALDENCVAAVTGEKTPEEAMEDAAKAWRKLVRKRGDKLIDAINAYQKTWPDIVDQA